MTDPASAVTYKSWLSESRRILEEAGVESPYLSAQLILEHVSRESRSTILAHPERSLDVLQRDQAAELLSRRLHHEPMAYLLGWKEFRNLRLRISPCVLIPRPETEELIDLAGLLAPKAKRILDAGTGSGCIPLSLSEVFPHAQIYACDISLAALCCAKENDPSHRVGWFQSSWLEAIAPGSLDLVLSNPPYLTAEDLLGLEPQVGRYEPRLALDGGRDGCECYRLLIPQAAERLKTGGALLLECSPVTVEEVSALLHGTGFGEVRIHRDLSGRDRFVSGSRR